MKPTRMRRVFPFVSLLVLVVGQSAHGGDSSKLAKPNVINILSDDQGYGDFSAHGNPVLKTPHLDRLRSKSIRLTDFHVAPMCTPTRGQFLTGIDACWNGATSVCAGRSFIRPGIRTMAEDFAGNGYRTALFGKWHLGDSFPNLPHFRGFHDAVYHLGWGITSMADTWLNDCFDPRLFQNGELKKFPGYCTEVLFNLSIDWIKQRQAAKEPFFLYLPTNAPHGPHWVHNKYKQPYFDKGPAAFFGMIANLDENVGRLETFLAESGLRDNTIVIFFHDNGGTAGVKTFNAGMRAGKTTYYDGGHRAACFIRWPNGKLGEPREIDELTEVQDLRPTLEELCGLSIAQRSRFAPRVEPKGQNERKINTTAHVKEHLDARLAERDGYVGVSLAPLLRGEQRQLADRKLVVQYGQKPEKWESAVLWQKWRLVKGTELYDLKSDPGQQTNVADKFPDVLAAMRSHYETWWSGIEPHLNDFVPIVIGSPKQNPVTLSAADWANVYCDNMGHLRSGDAKNSVWHIVADQNGEYEIALRRWPKESDAALSASVPEFVAVDGKLPPGKALPVAKVRLKIDGFDETKTISTDDKAATFRVRFNAGKTTTMQSWLLDADGRELSGAYFADVRFANE